MSHPNPSHDRDNEYPEDNHAPVRERFTDKGIFKHEMKKVRSGLQKVVGHSRRERHTNAKREALKKKYSKGTKMSGLFPN